MEIFDIIEDELDDFMYRLNRPRRNPVFRQRINYMQALDDTDFRIRFRLTKHAVNYVFLLIVNQISSTTERNYAISPINRLLLTLRYYATGSFLNVVGDFTGTSKASASRIVNMVSQAIAKLGPQFIKFSDVIKLQQEFYDIARFPRLVGAIDCTHVPIKSPGGDSAENYRDRKSQFSFNVQTVVSANLKIMDIVARWPGAAHDQTIFNNSKIKQRFMNKEFGNSLIVGDKGYENTFYLLTPLQNPITPAEHLYNESQIRSRNVVERTYGVWKNRFPVLSKKIILDVSRVQPIIVACAVLHNIAIEMKDDHFEEQIFDHFTETETELNRNIQDDNVRNHLINDYFASLLR
ncbi:putative nuclease HARBI1 [Melitaea cinxia]|uniref:putative nuclease HARBI1 n=1 Tax=Melitaea cinxia TaxID=113334 RepID=UPI001E270A62|nr:putative nuclease HARBI1 [Melitaea cinxia]